MIRLALASLFLLASAECASTPRPLADVSISMADGKKIRLNQYRGKVMVVALVSTTCDHCISSLQLLTNLQKEYGPRGFQALGVAANDGAQSTLAGFIRLQITFPVGYLDQKDTMQLCDFRP